MTSEEFGLLHGATSNFGWNDNQVHDILDAVLSKYKPHLNRRRCEFGPIIPTLGELIFSTTNG